jgi:hypothetical protein
MGDQEAIAAKVERAPQVEKALQWLGWLVGAVGAAGMAVYAAFWAVGDLSAEQGVSLVLGTTLAAVLSGATAYGTGISIGLGAERLQPAARAAGSGPLPQGRPASGRMTGGSERTQGLRSTHERPMSWSGGASLFLVRVRDPGRAVGPRRSRPSAVPSQRWHASV